MWIEEVFRKHKQLLSWMITLASVPTLFFVMCYIKSCVLSEHAGAQEVTFSVERKFECWYSGDNASVYCEGVIIASNPNDEVCLQFHTSSFLVDENGVTYDLTSIEYNRGIEGSLNNKPYITVCFISNQPHKIKLAYTGSIRERVAFSKMKLSIMDQQGDFRSQTFDVNSSMGSTASSGVRER